MPLKSERDQAPVARFGPRTRGLAAVAALCAVITISRAETSASPACDAVLPPSIYSSVGAAPNIEIFGNSRISRDCRLKPHVSGRLRRICACS